MAGASPGQGRRTAGHAAGSPQDQKLEGLAAEVERMPAVFEEVQKNRELHQRRLHELLGDTIRNIHQAKDHMQQKTKHVMDTTKSYHAKFEHDLSVVKETLHGELDVATSQMEAALDALTERMLAAEETLKMQHEDRTSQAMATLGPVRDEAQRLASALDAERRARRLQEERQEKLIADEVEAFGRLVDKEKFAREQQLLELGRWAEAEEQRAAKRLTHTDTGTREAARDIRVEHQAMARERVEHQQDIVECLASFMSRYRKALDADAEDIRALDQALASAAPGRR